MTVADTVVRGFLDAGHEVTVATTDVLDERRRIAADAPAGVEGARVVRFRNVSHRLAANAMYAPRGYRAWLREHIGEFDVVLLQDFYSAVNVMAARAAERAGVPYAVQPLGTLSPARERGRSFVKRPFLALWGRRTLRGATALIHSSDFEGRDFLEAGAPPDRLVPLPLPLDLPEARDVARTERPTISFVGRLHPIKGLDRLVAAMPTVLAAVPDAELVVAGPGDAHRRELEQQAERLGLTGAVRFLGFVSQEEKLELLRSSWVSALLSHSEGLPMATLEAMACATPVVLSAGCHLPEVDGVGGLVVPGEPDGAAAALVDLLTGDERREMLARGARRFAEAYRAEVVMPEMVALFESLGLPSSEASKQKV